MNEPITLDMSHLSKVSDKLLAKFARRAQSTSMVLPASMRPDFNLVLAAVHVELSSRGVKWQGAEDRT